MASGHRGVFPRPPRIRPPDRRDQSRPAAILLSAVFQQGEEQAENQDGFFNISWNTNAKKVDVKTNGLASISSFQLWVKDKLDIKIPLIVGEFNISTLDKEGEIKLYLSPSTASFNTNFSLDVKNFMNLTLNFDLIVDFEEPSIDNFMGLSSFLENLFKRKVEILTPAGVDSIRINHIKEGIKKSIVYA